MAQNTTINIKYAIMVEFMMKCLMIEHNMSISKEEVAPS
jgi:hypothetical protein